MVLSPLCETAIGEQVSCGCPKTPLLRQADLNRGPSGWESVVLSTEPLYCISAFQSKFSFNLTNDPCTLLNF